MLQCHNLALFGRSGDAWSPLEVKRSNWKRGTGNLLGNAPFQLGQTYLGDSSIYIIYIYKFVSLRKSSCFAVLKKQRFFEHTSSFKLQWMSSPPCGGPSLKLTASLHLKMDGWNTIFSLWDGPFLEGEVGLFWGG